MNELQHSATEDLDALLGEVVEDYLNRIDAGEQPEVEDYAAAHPEIALLIQQTFPALRLVNQSVAGSPSTKMDQPTKIDRPDFSRSEQLGDFRLLREIGSGGMGFVYEAEQLSMGRTVALKILPMVSTLQPKAIERFRNEVRAAAMLEHPNIVSVYSVGEERGVHYYAMQLIRGQSLAEVIRELSRGENRVALTADAISQVVTTAGQHISSEESENASGVLRRAAGANVPNPPLADALPATRGPASQNSSHDSEREGKSLAADRHNTEFHGNLASADTKVDLQARITTLSGSETKAGFYRSAAEIGIEAAQALQHAHEQGVFHRDIKPGNVMLDASSKPYITDFGLARIEADAGITGTGDLIGTLRYMSPEQAMAKPAISDGRSDIYSLGATLYELIGLRPVFDAKDRQQLLQQIAVEEPMKLRKIDRSVPGELETIVHKAIEKNPDDRYLSAAELAADLQAFLDDRTIQAKPPTVADKLSKWSRRHKPLVWTMAISVCAMVTMAISALTVSNLVIAQERQVAEQEAATANAVIGFITDDLLGAASPLNEPDRDIRLRTVVDRAAASIDDRLAGQPLVAAAIRTTLGETYRALGEYALAEAQLRDALATYTAQRGNDHRTTQECQSKLAHVLLDQGRDAQAEELFRAVFDARLEEFGDQHVDTLQSMSDLGVLSLYCGQHGTARLFFGHVVEERLKQLGEEHPLTLDAQHHFAEATSRLDSRTGNVEEAETLFRQVLTQRTNTLGPEHPYTLESRYFVAWLLGRQSKLKQAEAEFRDLLDITSETLGPNHPFTLRCQAHLARTLTHASEYDESHQLYSLALQEAKGSLGEEHPLTLQIQLGLAANYAAQRQDEQAAQMYEQSLRLLRQTLGEHHPLTHAAKRELLACYETQGLDGKASELRDRIESPEDLAAAMSDSWFWGQPLSFRARRELAKAERLAKQEALGGKQVPNVLNGFEATLLNGTRIVEGRFGQALLFDGQDDRANIEDRPALAFTGSMTIQCWLRIDSFPEPEKGHGTIVMRSDHRGGRDPYFLNTLPSGEVEFGVNSLETRASVSAKAPVNKLIHVAATLDDSNGDMRLFVDGQQVVERQTNVRPFSDLRLDRQPGVGVGNHFGIMHGQNSPFHGVIEQLTIVDSALSLEEIQILAEAGAER